MEFFNDGYSRDYTYSGIHGYHSNCGRYNKPKKKSNVLVGIELEVEFISSLDRERFVNDNESNWFYIERDGSLADSRGAEFITIPLLPEDAMNLNTWDELTEALSHVATSWDSPRCGLHVHISREALGLKDEKRTENLAKMLFFYNEYLKDSRLNTLIYGRTCGYNDHDGRTEESKAIRVLGHHLLKMKDLQKKVGDSLLSNGNDTRYFDINIRNEKTIEFRRGRGSLSSKRIVAIAEWCFLIINYCSHTPWDMLEFSDFVKYLSCCKINSEIISANLAQYIN